MKFIRIILLCLIPPFSLIGCYHDKNKKSGEIKTEPSSEQNYQDSKMNRVIPEEKKNASDEKEEDSLDKKIKAVDDFFNALGSIVN